MVLILGGNLEKVAHVKSDLCYLIRLKHLEIGSHGTYLDGSPSPRLLNIYAYIVS